MEKSLWLWGPLYQKSLEQALSEYSQSTLIEQHIAVDGGILAKSFIDTKESWCSIGDGDSANSQMDHLYPTDKAQSDLSLALEYASRNYKSSQIRAFGFSGERIDHQILNLGSFKRYLDQQSGHQIRIDGHLLALSPGSWSGSLKPSTVSLITLEPTTLSLDGGWKWSLKNKECTILDDLLLSNECSDAPLRLTSSSSIIIWSENLIDSWWQKDDEL